MPRLVTANCPRCGAALELRPGLDVVTCHYCGFRSMIEWEGRRRPPAYTPPPIDPNLGRIVAQVPQAAARMVLTIVIATTVVPAVIGAVLFAVALRPRSYTTPVVVTMPGDLPAGAVPTVTPEAPLGPRMVDAAELVKKARALALADSSDPILAMAVFFNVQGGLVDTADSNAGSIHFEYTARDPNAQPGKDVTNGRTLVHVAKGSMTSMKMSGSAPDRERKLDVPACPSLSAWNAAVQSGVPQNAVATLHLYYNGAFTPKSPTVWSVRVDGHDEYRREIDARTCQVVKNWGAPATSPRRR